MPWRTAFLFVLFVITTVAAAVRLAGIGTQVPLDDEWHALLFVLNRDWSAAWSTHSMGANSIPVNVSSWLLLRHAWWSETTLRLPSLAAGILAIPILGLLAARLVGRAPALVASTLLALSPLAIFYARNARPFASVLLFGSVAILALALRVRGGRPAWTWTWSACAFLSIYHHLWSLPAVLGPFLAIALLSLAAPRLPERARRLPLVLPAREVAWAAVLFGTLLLAFVVPAVLANPWWKGYMDRDRVGLESLLGLLELWTGADAPLLQVAFLILLVLGGARLLGRRDPASAVIALAFAGQAAALLVATQDDIHAPIQVARYSIALLPLVFIAAALGLETVLARVRTPKVPGILLALATLAWAGLVTSLGPLPALHARPNAFTNHSGFQYDYAPHPPGTVRERVFLPGLSLPSARVPAHYRLIAERPEIPGVLVYPMYCGDHFNMLYAWQEVVNRPMVVGYRDDLVFPPLGHRDAWIYANMPVDYVFGRVPRDFVDRVRFRAMSSVSDLETLRARYPGWALVVHTRNPLSEYWSDTFPGEAPFYEPAVELETRLSESDSLPVLFRADGTTAFLVPRAPSAP